MAPRKQAKLRKSANPYAKFSIIRWYKDYPDCSRDYIQRTTSKKYPNGFKKCVRKPVDMDNIPNSFTGDYQNRAIWCEMPIHDIYSNLKPGRGKCADLNFERVTWRHVEARI